jgi:hypothetical protein
MIESNDKIVYHQNVDEIDYYLLLYIFFVVVKKKSLGCIYTNNEANLKQKKP